MSIFSEYYLIEQAAKSKYLKDSSLDDFVEQEIKNLVPKYNTIDLTATVGSTSFSVEFFATIGEKRMQSIQMVEDGHFTEKEFNAFSKKVANYIRKMPNFDKHGINKYKVLLKK